MLHSRDRPKGDLMMKNKGFFAGLLCGALIFGGTTAYAAGVIAELSTQPIYVDGQQVSMTAYNIGGNNYVKLRDIGEKVGFNVYWKNGVQIDSDAAYTGVAPTQSTTAVTIPQTDAKLTLKAGDTVQCDDGSTYAITDMSRYDKSAFSSGPLGALPTATCDFGSFPTAELPRAEARHIQNSAGDYLFVRNMNAKFRCGKRKNGDYMSAISAGKSVCKLIRQRNPYRTRKKHSCAAATLACRSRFSRHR